MILARRAQPIVAGGTAQRRPRFWAIDEFFAGNRQAKLPCGTRALWDALSARKDNNERPEPGAPLALCPRLLRNSLAITTTATSYKNTVFHRFHRFDGGGAQVPSRLLGRSRP